MQLREVNKETAKHPQTYHKNPEAINFHYKTENIQVGISQWEIIHKSYYSDHMTVKQC